MTTPSATAPAGQVHTATQAAPADIARERFRALVHAHGDRNFECGECDGSPEERDDLCRSAGVALNRVMDAHSQLLAQNAALKAALENVLGFCATNQGMEAQMAMDDARAALGISP